MNVLELTDEQIWIVERALDFYSRVGIGQFSVVKDHPTFVNHLRSHFSLKKGPFEIGDQTERGEIVEIDAKGKWIKTKGIWGGKEEIRKWDDVENINYLTDYSKYHREIENAEKILKEARNILISDPTMPKNGSWGIYNSSVDDSCRQAYDMVQVIRHERWKKNPNRSNATVDSSIHFSHTKDDSSNKIKCKLSQE